MRRRCAVELPLWANALLHLDRIARIHKRPVSNSELFKESGYIATYGWLCRILTEFERRNIVKVVRHGKGAESENSITVKGAEVARSLRSLQDNIKQSRVDE